jgi:hypothetical protein
MRGEWFLVDLTVRVDEIGAPSRVRLWCRDGVAPMCGAGILLVFSALMFVGRIV